MVNPFLLIIYQGSTHISVCNYHFLLSRHSINASMEGTMHPKILTQSGTCIPFTIMLTWKIILARCAADTPTSMIVTMVVAGFMELFLSSSSLCLKDHLNKMGTGLFDCPLQFLGEIFGHGYRYGRHAHSLTDANPVDGRITQIAQ